MNFDSGNEERTISKTSFPFKRFSLATLSEAVIWQHYPGGASIEAEEYQRIIAHHLVIDFGVFGSRTNTPPFPSVTVTRQEEQLLISCGCNNEHDRLCNHEAQVLTAILRREDLGIFFNSALRHKMLQKYAEDYGLEEENDPDVFFEISFENNKLSVTSRLPNLLAVNKDTVSAMTAALHSTSVPHTGPDTVIFVVFRQHKYYKHLVIEMYNAPVGKNGKIKNPFSQVSPLDLAWSSDDPDYLKFYTGIYKFQNYPNDKRSSSDLAALKAVIKNPAGYAFYYHKQGTSENLTATNIEPVKTAILPGSIALTVTEKEAFYELAVTLTINNTEYLPEDLNIVFNYFLQAGDTLYLVDRFETLALIELLKKKNHLLVHKNKYNEFRSQFLNKLEDKLRINYRYIPAATPAQLQQHGFDKEAQKLIYLSDFGNHVMIEPVVRYGEVEIPVRTNRQIYAIDDTGTEFMVSRNEEAEKAFIALILKQHPHFIQQLENDLQYWYLHKTRFLEEDWFLKVFEEWDRHNITVLGFNELEGNRLNPYKVKVDIKVLSGINWFNADIRVQFGRKKASLKLIQKAIQKKSRYVQLDDGSLGILPEEWIRKFSEYFNNGEIIDESTLQISKMNFSAVEELYDPEMLDASAFRDLQILGQKLRNIDSIKDVEVPEALKATLRPYQKQGLSWLNFLDDLNFGGCLADDMGLGKSLQIIAFILLQRKKTTRNTNLIVVPSTLIFNWQQEVERFAPSVKIATLHGAERVKSIREFDNYEIILTSYGTLIADITYLKEYVFNYVFLDESQNIKNPETQRYKAARLLRSRNKIAITGTPVENNTFDLFSQLSFACPGLLGSKQYFKDTYSTPIDTFKDSRRLTELRQKAGPFILRRTKQEVAPELPDKTEIVLHCEMGTDQRKIYDAYEKEFREYISATTNEELKRNPMNVLKGLTKLRQICNAPGLLSEDDLSFETSAKMDVLMEQIETKSSQHKILVFSQFVSMLGLIKKELIKRSIRFEMLTGSTKNRGAIVNNFQNNPACRVFLISLKAGGTGLNLTEADYVYLVDPWWNPAAENQAIDRVHRIGQNKKVIAVRLVCPGTVEEKILKIHEHKRMVADKLVTTDGSFLSALRKEDLLNLL